MNCKTPSRSLPRQISNERGVVLAIMALLLFVLLGLAALAIDLGIMYSARTEAQRTADAAAHAGAAFLVRAPADENGARDEAVRIALRNPVQGSEVSIDRIQDIDIRLDSARVRVRVYRTGARGNPITTLFAGALGINQVDIAATAAAEVYPAATSRCVLPIALADRWCTSWNGANCASYSTLTDQWQGDPGEHYVPWIQDSTLPSEQWQENTNYTGWGDALRGEVINLRGGAAGGGGGPGGGGPPGGGGGGGPGGGGPPGQGGGGGGGGGQSFGITPWFSTFIYEGEPPGGAANVIAERVLNCDDRTTTQQDRIIAGPGFMTPVVFAFEALIAQDPTAVWNQSANGGQGCVTSSGSSVCRDSPRVRPIVLFDPRFGPSGPAGSSPPFPIANLAGVFVEAAQATPAANSFVRARFVEFMGENPGPRGALGGALSRVLRLVE